jgi:hypothetical protein
MATELAPQVARTSLNLPPVGYPDHSKVTFEYHGAKGIQSRNLIVPHSSDVCEPPKADCLGKVHVRLRESDIGTQMYLLGVCDHCYKIKPEQAEVLVHTASLRLDARLI